MENLNFKMVKRVLWAILFANFLVAVLKIVIGNIIESASMTADGFHSLSDGSSNIVGLIGLSLASKDKDKEHPYGHKKFEVITSMFIGGMLLVIAGKIIFTALSRFTNPVAPSITVESLIVLLITLAINIFVSSYENKMGKKLNSYILISDSMHTKSDIFVSIGVLITLLGVKLGLPPVIDPIASLVVSAFIIYAAYEIFKASIGVLVDQVVIDEKEIEEVTKKFDEVLGVHKIRSRGIENDIHVDMHLLVNPELSIEAVHTLSHDIERELNDVLNRNIQLIVHVEPYINNKV
ncbi:MAG: cation diffusion facilitator family transporter [Clostridium sp.]